MNNKTRKIAFIGVFSALSIVLYFLRFSLPMFPSFLKLQFSMLPIIICGFCYGFKTGFLILLIKTIIGVMISFASSFGIGEMADFFIGLTTLFASTFVYNRNKTLKGGIFALITGTIAWIVSACILNYFVLIPLYINFGVVPDVETFVAMCKVIPGINSENYLIKYIVYAALPFNLIIATLVSLVTFFVYKKVSNLIKK